VTTKTLGVTLGVECVVEEWPKDRDFSEKLVRYEMFKE